MKRAFRPSIGFWIFVGSWSLLLALVGWGATTPDLERTWRILERMDQRGFSGFTPGEMRALGRSLRRHPELIEALSGSHLADFVEPTEEKWIASRKAHLAVRPLPSGTLRIWTETRAHPSAYPLRVTFSADWVQSTVVFERDGRQSFDLPARLPTRPCLVDVTIETSDSHPFKVRVTGEAVQPEGGKT